MFYMHDTSAFLPHFYEYVSKFLPSCPMYYKLQRYFAKSTGLINVQWFLRNKTELFKHFINYDISLALKYKSAELPERANLIDKFPDLPVYINEDSNFSFINGKYPIGDYFNVQSKIYTAKIYNEEDRYVNEYIELGLLKYQKNYNAVEWKITL